MKQLIHNLLVYFVSILPFGLCSCTNNNSVQLGLLGKAIQKEIYEKTQENIHLLDEPDVYIPMRPLFVNDIPGVKGEFFYPLTDLKKVDGKELKSQSGEITYEMDFKAIANIESPYSDANKISSINFWGVTYQYNNEYMKELDKLTPTVSPTKYLFIQGIAYFELKESGWNLKYFDVLSAETINTDKIPK